MTAPPTGTVTFLFTDIEGSTALWERDSDAMRAALAQHDALMRGAIEAHGGYVFKTVGDAFCAAFDGAQSGLRAAVDAQRALDGADWSMLGDGGPLRARMGLHTGEAEARGGDYFGPSVNRVARIESAGHGGQTLISSTTCDEVADALPEGTRLRRLGEHRLRDLRPSEMITQVVVDGLTDVTRALRTAGAIAPQDRIIIADPSAPADEPLEAAQTTVVDRSIEETLDLLAGVVKGDESSAVLTTAQVRAVARHKPADWTEYRIGRIAEWSQPRYRLDGRFVELTLLVDQGEEAIQGRWQPKDERYSDLSRLVAEVPEPAVVVLGPPGSGKSTLLRHCELDRAIEALQGEGETVTFFVQLNRYAPVRPGDPPPAPGEWLAKQWAVRYPELPSLDALLARGNVTLLLDALNEMPAAGEAEFRTRVQLWKTWLQALAADRPGNRVVFSCRSLDYSQPLSTPDLRVPQVRIEPLSDDQVRDFVQLHSPARWHEIWTALEGSPQLEVLRSPYFLALLVEQVEATGEMPEGRAALFTGFVRQALRREIERGGPLFEPGELLTGRDIRRVTNWMWKSPHDLPERGMLVPKLARLAHAMQQGSPGGEHSQVRIDLDDALDLLDDPNDEAIVAAGEAMAVLDEDQATEEVLFIHQLVQEYFAARALAKAPDPDLVRAEWRATKVSPSVDEVLDGLDPADPLPGLPQTGWEETALLAAVMAEDPAGFLRGVMGVNLALAARCAGHSEVKARLPADLAGELRARLVERTESLEADLRDRIACGYALGALGDPRFERRGGPHGAYLMPPLVEIPGGRYPIGDDEPIEWSWTGASGTTTAHVPRHDVTIEAFQIGRFPVTNAEWACFVAAGGYDDARWWDTEAGRAWQRGELANEAAKANNRTWRKRFLDDPELLAQMVEEGRFANDEAVERWRGWMALDEAAFEAELAGQWQAKRETEPHFWRDGRYNHPSQPVVGICWYEARAYCAWLSAQTGRVVRLPTEVEHEATARGVEGRQYAHGDVFDRLAANTLETHVKRTSPVGVFPNGRTPEGVEDLAGNVYEWTSSLFGAGAVGDFETAFPYPYDPLDGREDPDAPPNVRRVVRGGAWINTLANARAASRNYDPPGNRLNYYGLRLVVSPGGGTRRTPPAA